MDSPSPLFSVRMRASLGGPHEAGGRHVSGAERLVSGAELETATLELLRRARERSLPAEHVRISVDEVSSASVHRTPCLDVRTIPAADAAEARNSAVQILARGEIAPAAIEAGFALVQFGPGGSGAPLRGAALLDASTGERLDPQSDRGVRASRFDYSPDVRAKIRASLQAAGLGHFRTYEALAVATKVLWSGVVAELCWSDDPEYVAGYVTTALSGYVRFPAFKPAGAVGGRVFFVRDRVEVERIVRRLEQDCLFIESLPEVR